MNTGCVSGQREELAWCPAVLLTAGLTGDGGSSDGMDPKAVLNGAMPGGSSSATPVPHVPCWATLLLSRLSAPGAAAQGAGGDCWHGHLLRAVRPRVPDRDTWDISIP